MQVSPVTCIAVVHLDPALLHEDQILETLKELGFPSQVLNVTMLQEGERNPVAPVSLHMEIEGAVFKKEAEVLSTTLSAHPGVVSAVFVDPSAHNKRVTTRVTVKYHPQELGARQVLARLSALVAFPVSLSEEDPSSSSSSSAAARAKAMFWRMLFAVICALPVVLISFIFPLVGGSVEAAFSRQLVPGFSVRTLIAWILSTPVQFGVVSGPSVAL